MVDALVAQDSASAIAWRWAQKTFAFRDGQVGAVIAPKVAQFSSWLAVPGLGLAITSDGIGTKIEVAERVGRYRSLGRDLVAMVVDDLAANGVEPVAVTNTLDVDRVDAAVIDELMQGLHDAAQVAGISVAGGEIAELGARIGGWGSGMHFNWCATAIGVLPSGWQPIDGSAVRAGDAVVLVASGNWRSNGFTALRRGLQDMYGDNWHTAMFQDRTWGDWLLEPCRIFAPLVTALRRAGVHPHGLAHITGGGLPSKLGRTLKSTGLGAHLDAPWQPTPAMQQAQRLAGIPDQDAWQHWNMGNGFALVVPPEQVAAVLQACDKLGYAARQGGQVVAQPTLYIDTPDATHCFPLHGA